MFVSSVFTGNGYIEGKELENFFQELEKARKGSGMVRLHFTPVPGVFGPLDLSKYEDGLSCAAPSPQTWGLFGLNT